jgi:hypothetical protein
MGVIHTNDGYVVSEENPLHTSTTTKEAIPYDHQATYLETAQTHTSVVVAPSTTSPQSTWQPVPLGMTDFIQNLTVDASVANLTTLIIWSEDGTTQSGKTDPTVTAAGASTHKTSNQWFPVGGAFYKASVWNGDATPRTCSANIKFRP